MTSPLSRQSSSYLEYLPAVLRQPLGGEGESFLGRFLLAFEEVLTGLGDPGDPGLEEKIGLVWRIFDPNETPDEFLPWLANWVSLSLHEEWDATKRRAVLREIVRLYPRRGTKAGLREMLVLYADEERIKVCDFPDRPHYFEVTIYMEERDVERLRRLERITHAIVEQERPAHSIYRLIVDVPTIQIGKHSTVGKDTLIGRSAIHSWDPRCPDSST